MSPVGQTEEPRTDERTRSCLFALTMRGISRYSAILSEREGKKVRLRHDGNELRTIEM